MAKFEHGLIADEERPLSQDGLPFATRDSVAAMIQKASIVSEKVLKGPAFDPEQPVSGHMHGIEFDGPLADVTAEHCPKDHLAHDWPKGAVAYLTGITAPQG